MQAEGSGRRPYTAPKLTIYGDMAKFTAAGVGTRHESKGGMSAVKIKP